MESQEKRKQFFEATVKNTRFEQLSASCDIGQGIIMGYEQALKDSKQTEIDIAYKKLEPLLQIQERCLQQMNWCDEVFRKYPELRLINFDSTKEAYSDIFTLVNSKIEAIEYFLKTGNYGEL